VAAICRAARERAWGAYRAVEAFTFGAGCRRRALLDHFGDSRPGNPAGRCCDVCDPTTLALPDPATLAAPARRRPKPGAPPAAAVDAPLLDALRAWRLRASNGKPAYTVAHNSTLEAIAAGKPSTLAELAAIRGIGPAFVKRHGRDVLALVGAPEYRAGFART
jgi:ATP-dependent DNA helicase RecQ